MAVEIGWGYPSKKPKKVKKEEPKKEETNEQYLRLGILQFPFS